MSSAVLSSEAGTGSHYYHHICLLSDLTGSKFSGNRAALISFPHTTDSHLVTCAGTQNLGNKKNFKKDILDCLSLHVYFWLFFFFISRHRRQSDTEIRYIFKHDSVHRHSDRHTGDTTVEGNVITPKTALDPKINGLSHEDWHFCPHMAAATT